MQIRMGENLTVSFSLEEALLGDALNFVDLEGCSR
jgi:hypothetical protein